MASGQLQCTGAGQPQSTPKGRIVDARPNGINGGQRRTRAVDEGARYAGHPGRVKVQYVGVGVAGVRCLAAGYPGGVFAFQAKHLGAGRREAMQRVGARRVQAQDVAQLREGDVVVDLTDTYGRISG